MSTDHPSPLRLRPLPGGLTLTGHKALSNGTPIQQANLAPYFMLPLAGPEGELAQPIVAPNEPVLTGQLIATPSGARGRAIHAPTSGVVQAIRLHPIAHASLPQVNCLIIQADGDDRWAAKYPLTAYRQHPRVQLLAHLRNSGIVGLGGAGFPTHTKLSAQAPIHLLIVNACECEPYITADDRLLRERADDVLSGLAIVHHLLNPQRVVIALEDDKPQALAALTQAITHYPDLPIQLCTLPTQYPSGSERQLIYRLTGITLSHEHYPADQGILCHNVGTLAAIHRSVHHGEPMIQRITTVTGKAVGRAGNYQVRIGTPLHVLLQQAQIDWSLLQRLIIGGPMMGFALNTADAPLLPTTHCIWAATQQELPKPQPQQPCIRCGACEQVCPAQLLPQQLYGFAQANNAEQAQRHRLFDCIECGACAYVCPSQLPLVQYYRQHKHSIRQQQQADAQAQQAKHRFEAKQRRLQADEQLKQAKRRARADKAAQARQVAAPPQDH